MTNEFSFEFSERQTEALDLLFENSIDEVLYGGAKGGGKTALFCYSAVLDAEMIVRICKINDVPKYPHLIGFLGRMQAVDFNDTTLETWKKLIPPSIYQISKNEKEIILFDGRVKYAYGGMDRQEEINKFNSAEYARIKIDQAEELTRDLAAKLRGTQGRTRINGIAVPCNILWTANPAECFLKEDFNPQGSPDITVPANRRFVQALPTDNPFIDSSSYIARLKDAWKHHPEILKAYVEGDWSATAGQGFLLTPDLCRKLVNLQLPISRDKIWLSGDPAWLGEKPDEIVAYVFEGNRVVDCSFKFNQETTTTAADWIKLGRQYNATTYGIDSIGVGAGVVSDCRVLAERGVEDILAINSSMTPEDDDNEGKKRPEQNKVRFRNIRAEMWWTASEELKENKWVLPNDPELIRQLCAVRYEIRNGKINIEDKDIIKKRLGNSPNRADALIQGIWMKKMVKRIMRQATVAMPYKPKYKY